MQNEITATQLLRTAAQLRQIHRAVQAEIDESLPQVGDLATYQVGSDSYPARVTKVSPSGSQITLTDLDYQIISGSAHDGSAEYRIFAHPLREARTQMATRRRGGVYRLKGWDMGGRVSFGSARVYRDPSF